MTAQDAYLASQRLLVIAPHADDECFGCAGTMARIKSLGGEVYCLVCSVGDLKHYDGKEGIVTAENRAGEFEQVMRFLGVDDWDILYRESELHLRLDTIPRRELVGKLERESKLALDRIRPTMLAIPVSSYNQDHEAVFRAAWTAARPGVPSIKPFQPLVLGYDNTSLFWSLERDKFHPNFYIDISNFVEHKLRALSMHKSQQRDSIHHSSLQNVEYTARVRGREVSVDAAEAFMAFRHLL
ncbi:MAG TPA: PIG-L family deacetylase [Candidatus Hydrogenedentes bacterium]|nr:PIG-L family deacetylase [Candidatus Hydrogenedentota bacterium]HOS04360.1 PIG-L family deacetylase [Candidatus Hydrogenedentota bacterium]